MGENIEVVLLDSEAQWNTTTGLSGLSDITSH